MTKLEHFWQNWRSEKIHGPLTKWQDGAFLTKMKFAISQHTVCTHSILMLINNLKSTFQKWQNGPFFNNIEKWKKIHFPVLRKWQNWALFDKIKEAKKYTGLSENDKIKHFWQNWRSEKKSTVLSQNDKIEHFWQNWRSEKIHEPLTKWQNGAFLTKIVWYITTHSVHIVYLCLSHNLKSIFQKWQNGPFLTKLKTWKKYTLSSLTKWQSWAFLTKLKNRKNP